jgi:hypothetical protein
VYPLTGQLHSSDWASVLDSFRALVGPGALSEIQLTESVDQLGTDIKHLKIQPSPKKHFPHDSDTRDSVGIVLDGLQALGGIANALALTSPGIGPMIWGSARLIITVGGPAVAACPLHGPQSPL